MMYNILSTPRLDVFLATHISIQRREKKAEQSPTQQHLTTRQEESMSNFSKGAKSTKAWILFYPDNLIFLTIHLYPKKVVKNSIRSTQSHHFLMTQFFTLLEQSVITTTKNTSGKNKYLFFKLNSYIIYNTLNSFSHPFIRQIIYDTFLQKF